MVAKRIEIRTAKMQSGDDSDTGFSVKDINLKGKNFSTSIYWIIGIIIMLGTYHCYTSYQEQIKN